MFSLIDTILTLNVLYFLAIYYCIYIDYLKFKYHDPAVSVPNSA